MSCSFINDKLLGTVIKKMALFFESVALGMITLNEELAMETVVGEMADVMEQIWYDASDRRSLGQRVDNSTEP